MFRRPVVCALVFLGLGILLGSGTVWISARIRQGRELDPLRAQMRAFEQSARWDSARDAATRVLALIPLDDEALQTLNRSDRAIAASKAKIEEAMVSATRSAENAKAALEAERVAERVKSLDAKHLYSTTLSMEDYWRAIDECKQDFDELCAKHPDVSEVWYWRGRVNLLLGSYVRADCDLSQALELDPQNYPARLHRVQMYAERMLSLKYLNSLDPEALRADVESLGKLARQDLVILNALPESARFQEEMKRLRMLLRAGSAADPEGADHAIHELKQGAAQTTWDEESLVLLGLFNEQKGDHKTAEECFSMALRQKPRSWRALLGRSRLRQGSGDLLGARCDAEAALAINPRCGEALRIGGLIRQAQGDLDEAIAAFDAALALDPADFDSLFHRSLAKRDKGDARGAAQGLQYELDHAGAYWPHRGRCEELLRLIEGRSK